MTRTLEKAQYEALALQAVEALKNKGFDAVYAPDREKAAEQVMQFIKPQSRVGFGGSTTLAQLGLPEKVRARGAEILDHNRQDLSPEEKGEIRRQQLLCDVFLSSTNALTLEGALVNVDGNGNRTNAITFGPRKVVIVAGANKIRRNLEEALARIEGRAAPMNNKRLETGNPCVSAGICSDCSEKKRICRVYSVLKWRPAQTDITVVLVGESLGY